MAITTTLPKVNIPSERNFVLYELNHALMDGPFEPTQRTKDARFHYREATRELKRKYIDSRDKEVTEPITLTFWYPSTINTQAESILLAVLKIAGAEGLEVQPNQLTLPLFAGIDDPGKALEKPSAKVTCTMWELLQVAGMNDDKRSYQQLKFYLRELSKTNVQWRNHATKWEGSSNLLAFAINDNGSLVIQVNWRLSAAILGTARYAEIDLDERNALKRDASKTLHRWLSAHLWRQTGGRQEYIEYNTLVKHIWSQEASTSRQRARLATLKNEVLPEIGKLAGWVIEKKTEGAIITHHQGDYHPNNPPVVDIPKKDKRKNTK